jgi:hypothetical protein
MLRACATSMPSYCCLLHGVASCRSLLRMRRLIGARGTSLVNCELSWVCEVRRVGKGSMNASRLLGVWGIFSISWATLYFHVFALNPREMEFERLLSDILSPPVFLLIVGGPIVRIIRGFQRSA